MVAWSGSTRPAEVGSGYGERKPLALDSESDWPDRGESRGRSLRFCRTVLRSIERSLKSVERELAPVASAQYPLA